LFLFSEVGTSDAAALLALVNQAAPAGYTYALATFTGSGTEDSASGAQAAIYRTDLITEIPSGHIDLSTGASRNSDRWLFQLNGYTSANARFYVYQSHLKASSGSANVATRLSGVQTLRANCDALGVGVRAIYSGDMNFYTRTESGYQAFIAAGNGAAFDPLGTADWTGASNAWKHTQSPRDILADGLVGGGMDDRFDMMLPTAQLMDGAGIAFITGSYRAVGNDGNHYNLAVNSGTNSYFPAELSRSPSRSTRPNRCLSPDSGAHSVTSASKSKSAPTSIVCVATTTRSLSSGLRMRPASTSGSSVASRASRSPARTRPVTSTASTPAATSWAWHRRAVATRFTTRATRATPVASACR
jgi:hypothetical protein